MTLRVLYKYSDKDYWTKLWNRYQDKNLRKITNSFNFVFVFTWTAHKIRKVFQENMQFESTFLT